MSNLKSKMEAFSKKTASNVAVEGWETRYGKSVRVVKRSQGGQFVSNVSAKQLSKTV